MLARAMLDDLLENSIIHIKTVKHPPSVVIWGSFSAAGRGSLAFIRKGDKISADKYIEILHEKLQIHMVISRTTTFQ